MRPELYGIDVRATDVNGTHAEVIVEWAASDPLEQGRLDAPDEELHRARRWAAGIVGRVVLSVTEQVLLIITRPGAHYCQIGGWEGCGITQFGVTAPEPASPWEVSAFLCVPANQQREVTDLCRAALTTIAAADSTAPRTVSPDERTAPAPRGHLAVVRDGNGAA